MNVLVTGGRGFIGSHLVKAIKGLPLFANAPLENKVVTVGRKSILGKGYVPSFVFYAPIGSDDLGTRQGDHFAYDMKNDGAVKRMFSYYEPDVIFHLAGNPLVKNPEGIFRDNVEVTHSLLRHCPEGCRFIFASSVVVYGDGKAYPKCTEYDVPKPSSEYGITKLASEHLVNMYTDRGKVKGVNLRLCATVGSGLTHGVIFDFIRKLRENNTLEILGSEPGSTKPYLHVDDAVNAFLLMMAKRDAIGSWNVVPDNEININQLATAVMSELEIKKPIEWLGDEANWIGDNRFLCASNGKIKSFGWSPNYWDSFEAVKQCVKEIK